MRARKHSRRIDYEPELRNVAVSILIFMLIMGPIFFSFAVGIATQGEEWPWRHWWPVSMAGMIWLGWTMMSLRMKVRLRHIMRTAKIIRQPQSQPMIDTLVRSLGSWER